MKFFVLFLTSMALVFSQNQNQDHEDSLEMFLNEGRGEIIVDKSDNENHAQLHNGATYRRKNSIFSIEIDEFDDYVSIESCVGIRMIDSFTISLWIKPFTLNKWQTLISCSENENHGYLTAFSVYISNTNRIRFIIGTGKVQHEIHSNEVISNSCWNNIVVVFSGSKMSIFINGEESSKDLQKQERLITTKNPIILGKIISNNTYTYGGQMSEIALYSEALDKSVIIEKYNESVEKFLKKSEDKEIK